MRVIAGEAKGRKLISPEGTDVRPTPERVKEAVFSMLHTELPGSSFLDLFCGSGQMGIEALSRGARRAVLVEGSPKNSALVRQNLTGCRLQERGEVVRADAFAYAARCCETFDFIFLDPPYHKDLAARILPELSGLLRENGRLLAETERRDMLPEQAGSLKLVRQTIYGIVKISEYRKG